MILESFVIGIEKRIKNKRTNSSYSVFLLPLGQLHNNLTTDFANSEVISFGLNSIFVRQVHGITNIPGYLESSASKVVQSSTECKPSLDEP